MATGMREKTANVGGIIKRIWYAMTGATQGAELMSVDDTGKFKCVSEQISGLTGTGNRMVVADSNGNLSARTAYTFAEIDSKPTTLAGYGITDASSEKWSTITISGDADKYYPVVFDISGIQNKTIFIKKHVHNYATWDGALTLEVEVQSSGYSGYAGYTNIKRLLHVGANPVKYFVASVSQSANANDWLTIWLLGGGRTYNYKKNLETGQNPIVYYSLTTLAGTNGTVDVKTAVDSSFYQTSIVPADNYNYVNTSDVATTATANKIVKRDANGAITNTQYKLSALNTAPVSATATGILGEIRIDANYIYVCTATNTWKRTPLATW